MKINFNGLLTGLVIVLLVGTLVPAHLVFASVHPTGTNVISNGTVYMVINGQRRAYTSVGAFLSYGFNSWGTVVPASSEDLALNEGSFIPPRDGKIVCSDRGADKGTCYLITNGKRAGFVSEQIFKQLGFSFSTALYGDVSFLDKDSDIANSSDSHRAGVLINREGTIYLVSSNGLMGVPSPEVLNTWGYTFSDAIKANSKDYALNQSSIIMVRQAGQLKPSDGSSTSNNFNQQEAEILKDYIDAYPSLPTQEVNSPEDLNAIAKLLVDTEFINKIDDLYPYLSSTSIELLNKIPTLKKNFDSTHDLYQSTSEIKDVRVLNGKQYAIAEVKTEQALTDYSESDEVVLIKENSTWKIDYIGTVKLLLEKDQNENPTDAFVTGKGKTNLSIVGMEYEDKVVTINDKDAKFLIRIKNNGKTTIHEFVIGLSINDTDVYVSNVSYKLSPKDEIVLAIPIADYWTLPHSAGEYRTDVAIGFGDETVDIDSDVNDNMYYVLTNFQ